MTEYRSLNVGSGSETHGTDRLDCIQYPNVTKVWDLSIGTLPYEDNTFDEVYCRCLFEHLENPNTFLLECKRVLKVGGIIRIMTDHGAFIFWHYNLLGLKYGGDWTGRKHGDYAWTGSKIDKRDMHYAFYTPEHLRNHFDKAGLEVVECRLALHGEIVKASLKARIIQKLMSIFLRRFGYPIVYAIGRKPGEK